MTPALMHLVSQYKELDQQEKIEFLDSIRKTDPHKWDYVSMNEGVRQWYQERKGE